MGGGGLLGYQRSSGRYSSFSSETISFEFQDSIDSFGISLSQGNQSGGVRNIGHTLWSVVVDDTFQYTARSDYNLDNFSGESFLGLKNLNGINKIEVSRIFSTANIVWNIRDINYKHSISVNEPTSIVIFLLGLGLVFNRITRDYGVNS
jgi:hypothetical protein